MVADSNKLFLYRDLSYKIRGCFYDVYNELGPAHKEQIYQEALKLIFKEKDTISCRGVLIPSGVLISSFGTAQLKASGT